MKEEVSLMKDFSAKVMNPNPLYFTGEVAHNDKGKYGRVCGPRACG